MSGKWIAIVWILSGCLFTLGCQPKRASPNVLLILADDMAWGDLSAHRNPHIQTPHLDNLRRQSRHFSHFFVSPVCAPTRASLLTGRYAPRSGVRGVTNGFETMRTEVPTLADYLGKAGYRTGIIGKWHLGEYAPYLPPDRGFDHFLGFRTGHTADYYDATLEYQGRDSLTAGYVTEVLTQGAMDFMEAAQDEPFFCYLAYQTPHTPLQIDTAAYAPFFEKGLGEREARIYAMIEHLDGEIGRLLQFLDEQELAENTLVIFMSDNGPISGWKAGPDRWRFNDGLRDQKFTRYEGGIRTASFWRMGQKWKVGQIETPAAHIDVLPTILDMAGLKEQPEWVLDGRSLLPLLSGEQEELPNRDYAEAFAFENTRLPGPERGNMLLSWPWKLVDDTALFRLDTDPGEAHNLAAERSDTLASMQLRYRRWWQKVHENEALLHPMAIPVPDERPVLLQPHHGFRSGESLAFTGHRGLIGDRIGTHPHGVDGDWVAGWPTAADFMSWWVEAPGQELDLRLLMRGQTGALTWEVQWGDELLMLQTPAWEEADWALGPSLPLSARQGRTKLSLRISGPADRSGELALRALQLQRVPR